MAFQKEKEETPAGFIDLGEDYEKRFGGILGATQSESEKEEKPKVYYPELRFELESLRDLPKEGTAIIHYRKTLERDEKTTRGDKEETHYICEIEVHSIKPEKSKDADAGEEPASEMDSNDEAIEKGLEAVKDAG